MLIVVSSVLQPLSRFLSISSAASSSFPLCLSALSWVFRPRPLPANCAHLEPLLLHRPKTCRDPPACSPQLSQGDPEHPSQMLPPRLVHKDHATSPHDLLHQIILEPEYMPCFVITGRPRGSSAGKHGVRAHQLPRPAFGVPIVLVYSYSWAYIIPIQCDWPMATQPPASCASYPIGPLYHVSHMGTSTV